MPDDVPVNRILAVLQDALRDVHSFSRTRALPALRTSDKRIFLETRATLYRLIGAGSAHPGVGASISPQSSGGVSLRARVGARLPEPASAPALRGR